MKAKAYILAAVLILALAVVFLAPSVNLEPTALRAVRAAAVIFLGIFVASHSLVSTFVAGDSQLEAFQRAETAHPVQRFDDNLIDLFCSRLC